MKSNQLILTLGCLLFLFSCSTNISNNINTTNKSDTDILLKNKMPTLAWTIKLSYIPKSN